MAEATGAAPRAWWLDLRWLTAVVVSVTATSILLGLLGPEPRIVVSRETTFITSPLRADGLPDYATHVLDRMGRGTPPGENAAAAVLQATWPMGLDATGLAAVCRELGLSGVPPDVAPLAWADADGNLKGRVAEFLATRRPVPSGPGSLPDPARLAGDVIDRSWAEPWRADDCPPLAAWAGDNSPALDLVVAGAARPRSVMPPAELLVARPGAALVPMSFDDLTALRNIARSLAARAMLRLGEGRTAAAWRDVHALHRLARLIVPPGRDDFLVAHLVSVALGSVANAATLQVLQAPKLSPEDAATIRHDLEALPPRADAGSAVAMERLLPLEVVVSLATTHGGDRARVLTSVLSAVEADWTFHTSLDLNVLLRAVNDFHDRVAAAVRLTDRVARDRAFDAIDASIAAGVRRPTGWRRWARVLRLATNRTARSEDVAARTIAMMLSSTQAAADAFDRARGEFALLRVAAALADFRARGLGGPLAPYPQRLDELVPAVLAELPCDPFSGDPLTYDRRGDGYLLYAVGVNGVDDAGTSGDVVRGEWVLHDPSASRPPHGLDTVIRLPTPRCGLPPSDEPAPPRRGR